MSPDIALLFKRAQDIYTRFQDECKKKSHLTLVLAESLYNLRRLRISVAYRLNGQPLSKEDRNAIDEVCRMSQEVEDQWKKVQAAAQAPAPAVPTHAPAAVVAAPPIRLEPAKPAEGEKQSNPTAG